MKPIYLEFCGINSFSEPAKIDFTKLLKGGVFGIFGDTGSGKSTILDAIHFALYGEVDRVPKSFNDCINHRVDGASVTFDFELTKEGKRRSYRVERIKKRKSASGKAYLYERTGEGKFSAVAEGTRDVNGAIEEIVGLTFEDFKTCIALPQGDFATLVKATPSERVKLVARLFNLEKYGERLSSLVNEKYKKADEESNIIKAKMGESAELREEEIGALRDKITADKEDLKNAKIAQARAEETLKKAENTAKEKKEYEALIRRLETLEARLPQMEEKRELLASLPKAKQVVEKAETLSKTIEEKENTKQALREAKEVYLRVTADAEKAKAEYKAQNYEEKLLGIGVDIQKHLSLASEVADKEKAEQELKSCQSQYKALLMKCPKEAFEEKRKELEDALALLGDDENLVDYIKRTYKGVLLGETYKGIRADLEEIKKEYPQTAEKVSQLLKKYAVVETEESRVDVAEANLRFREIETEKKGIKKELDSLDKREKDYEANEREKTLLEKQGKLLRERYERAKEKIALLETLASKETLLAQEKAIKAEKAQKEKEVEEKGKKATDCYAETQKIDGRLSALIKSVEEFEKALEKAFTESGFFSVEKAYEQIRLVGDEKEATDKVKEFFEEFGSLTRRRKETDEKKFIDFDEETLILARESKTKAVEETERLNRLIGAEEREVTALEKLLEKKRALEKELLEKEKYKNLCDELKQLLRGNRFLEYVASEYLQEISVSAGKTLLSLTGGRYFLRYEEKEFKVGDNFDGGKTRGVKTLSGGETFLVSLSLALSLSSAICLKSLRPIEFFFLDEGFGTLDSQLVDVVMDTLGRLGKNFSVGLISHVEELKRRIEQKILVTPATETRGSQIQVETW